MKQYLQVKISDHTWSYVFCHNEKTGIVLTEDRKNAISGNTSTLLYFENRYGNKQFRLVP